jgi:pre-mRNA cleavage complex 2 protein Pcf11
MARTAGQAGAGAAGGGRTERTALDWPPGRAAPGYFTVDRALFTNDGIRILNEAIVGLLYDVGLPFVRSADGRRFASQLDLWKHLDALFRRGQLERTMAMGWYLANPTWSGEDKDLDKPSSNAPPKGGDGADDRSDPADWTVPADEARDRCVICGINFKMVFDNDDGIYKDTNCREVEVLNDEAVVTESDEALVHVTRWRNLGSPDQLTFEQTLQDAMRS